MPRVAWAAHIDRGQRLTPPPFFSDPAAFQDNDEEDFFGTFNVDDDDDDEELLKPAKKPSAKGSPAQLHGKPPKPPPTKARKSVLLDDDDDDDLIQFGGCAGVAEAGHMNLAEHVGKPWGRWCWTQHSMILAPHHARANNPLPITVQATRARLLNPRTLPTERLGAWEGR